MELSLSKVKYLIIISSSIACVYLYLSGTNSKNPEENDAVISQCLVGLGAQPRQQRLMMYAWVLTFSVCHPAVYLPHFDQLSERMFVCEEERVCLFLCLLYLFVYVSPYGAGWVQYCAADARNSEMVNKLKTDHQKSFFG